MLSNKLFNTNILSEKILPTPREILAEIPESAKSQETVLAGREWLRRILTLQDKRLFVVVGPCSIHDEKAAIEYAERLKVLSERVSDSMLLVMRVYFEKPRTVVGWKGFINDPYLDDSFKIEDGLRKARKLLLQIAELGLPSATEALDPLTPQYLADLVSWMAIGARTTESQTHREMASGLSSPVGIKNGTDGSIEVAINALQAVSHPHHFLGMTLEGRSAVFSTRGNSYAHIVLRGGKRPNYDSESIRVCEEALRAAKLPPNIVVDCSHGNSLKQPELQPKVLTDCIGQILEGNNSIRGFMLESHIHSGNQPIPKDLTKLRYGVSVTDGCLDWKTTEETLLNLHERVLPLLEKRLSALKSLG